MHTDRNESALVRNAGSPIISISLGNSCLFRFGNSQTKGTPYRDIELRSGDLFLFGNRSSHGGSRSNKDLPWHSALTQMLHRKPPILC